MIDGISHVTINFLEPPGSNGVNTQTLIRLRTHDFNEIQKACDILGMKQSDFLRTAAVQSARQIVAADAEAKAKEVAAQKRKR